MTDHLAAVLIDTLDDEALDALAARLAPRLAAHLAGSDPQEGHHDGYLNPARAADHMGVKRKRIYDLTSAGVLIPDGYDGRTPLYLRATLDAYVRSGT